MSDIYASRKRPSEGLPIFVRACFVVSMKRKIRHVCGSLARLGPLFVVTADKHTVSLGQ